MNLTDLVPYIGAAIAGIISLIIARWDRAKSNAEAGHAQARTVDQLWSTLGEVQEANEAQRRELEAQRQENARLRRDYQALKEANDAQAQLLQELRQELDAQRDQFFDYEAKANERADGLRGQITNLKGQLTKLRNRIAQLEDENAKLKAENERLRGQG